MPGPINVGHGTSFQAIHDQFKPGFLGSGGGEHVRFKGDQLYTHGAGLHGRGAAAAEARAAKYESGAVQVRAALVRDFGADFADRVLTNVGTQVGRDLSSGVTRSDLTLIKREVDASRSNAAEVVDAAITAPGSRLAAEFRAHLAKEHSEENLDFTQAVNDYRNSPPSQHAAKGQAIFDTYIRNNDINLPADIRKDIREAFTGGGGPPGPHVFDDAFSDVHTLMVNDSATRFVAKE